MENTKTSIGYMPGGINLNVLEATEGTILENMRVTLNAIVKHW